MADHTTATERYLDELSSLLVGSRCERTRLREEIRSHVEDALCHGDCGSETQILEQLGAPRTIARAWALRCQSHRSRQRRRVALLAAASASGALLAVTQYAQGGQSPGRCTTATNRQPRPVVRHLEHTRASREHRTENTGGGKQQGTQQGRSHQAGHCAP